MRLPPETFLQYIWQHQLLEGEMCTAEGQVVVVERAGVPNHDAGPDFFDARVRVGGTLWAGNVEVHVRASDWNLHHHGTDRAYDNVVLHVVYDCDAAITLQNCHSLPTLCVAGHIPQAVWDNYEALMNPPHALATPCQEHLARLAPEVVGEVLNQMLMDRLEEKCGNVRRLLAESRGSWERCCYWLLAHYFGGRANGLPFELMARATDLNLLARWRDRPERIEAILMGQAGLLEGNFSDEYPRCLQADYRALRLAARLNPIEGYLWKFFRLRPYGFPTVRISQFAQLICSWHNLFGRLLEATSAAELQQLFDVTAADYWTDHYQFDRPSPGKPKRLADDFAQLLVVNAWVPLLFEYGAQHGMPQYSHRAVHMLEQLRPESNQIIRQWVAAGIRPASAAQSQALLQLRSGYCQRNDCLRCPIGHKIIAP